MFPVWHDLSQLDPPSDELLKILVGAELNLNELYEGRCLLDAVEALVGPTGQPATILKELGARRISAEGRCST